MVSIAKVYVHLHSANIKTQVTTYSCDESADYVSMGQITFKPTRWIPTVKSLSTIT